MRNKALLHNRDIRRFRSLAKKNQHKKIKTRKVILVENRQYTFDLIGLLAFLPTAVKHYNANIVVYEMLPSNLLIQFKNKIRHRFSLIFFISSSKLISITSQDKFLSKYQEIISDLTSKKTTKKILENYNYKDIIISNTFFNTVTLEIQMAEYDIDSLAIALYGNQTKSIDDGIYTIYDSQNNIYRQYNLYEIRDQFNELLYEVRQDRGNNIDFSKNFTNITQ